MPFRKGDPNINRVKPGPGRPPDKFRKLMRGLASRNDSLVILDRILRGDEGVVSEETSTEQGEKGVTITKVTKVLVVDGDLYLKALAHATTHGYGRPAQSIELTGPNGGPIPVEHTRAALAGRIAGLASRIRTDSVVSEPHANGDRSS